MKGLLSCVLVLAACKPEEVPFKPPPPDDAAPRAADAAAQPIDAPPAAKPTATKVVVGDHTSCAVMSDATLRCWGRNADGQLGVGTTADAATAVKPALRGVKDVVLGAAHTCALLDDSSVTCWGRINFGKRDSLVLPAAVPGLTGATRLFAVGSASCATLKDTSLVCWGDVDARGRLLLSAESPERRVPAPAAGLFDVVALTANGALHADGTVSHWRAGAAPTKTGLADVVEIASSSENVCSLRRDGSIACAGPMQFCAPPPAPAKKPAPRPKRGKQRAKTSPKVAAPAAPLPPPIEVLKLPKAKRLAFDVGLCAVTTTGRLQCLDGADACQLAEPWPGLTKVDSVSGFCARTIDGNARCWSVDSKSRVVTSVAGVSRAVAIAASSSHACALVDTGEIFCWGSNKSSALGRGEAHEGVHADAKTVVF